ncbi:MAG TPA: hypothetical protein VFQ85_10020 [Mycobacteriales bacterium]|nr:hypothetical protein [Mycobacteriales bacterium]
MSHSPSDRGSVIVGWLTKVAVVLTLFGVVAFDGVSVMVANVSAQDTATAAAMAGADMWRPTQDVQKAYHAAVSYAEEHGATIAPEDFSIDPDGTVRVKVQKDATTLVLYRTKSTRKWAHIVATGSGKSLS